MLQLLCVLWHCHDGAVDHLHPFGDAVCIEDFRQTVVDIPVSRNRLSVLKRYGDNVAEFCKETRYHLFGALLFLLNFTGGFSSGKTHTADCCFVSGSNWYTHVSSPGSMS